MIVITGILETLLAMTSDHLKSFLVFVFAFGFVGFLGSFTMSESLQKSRRAERDKKRGLNDFAR